ncbi:uncharacterized protein LOC108039201 [Drosophila rhopaloa]|uniref:Uncharacterized protein LOC108039201 n=1 Tax=Drosophila rhopaloa TaxID=1041015 RepID=A0A6P4E154_DRORH|nr:uncharacterized protein LOC108039201 [Drosophila rhopaloa]
MELSSSLEVPSKGNLRFIIKNGRKRSLYPDKQNMWSTSLPGNGRLYTELDSEGRMFSRAKTPYECQLEDDVEQLQEALFTISSHYAKIQFRLRQIASASSGKRDSLLKDLERLIAQGLDGTDHRQDDELSGMRCNSSFPGNVRAKQNKILCQLRGRLEDLVGANGVCFQADCCEAGRNKSDHCHKAKNDVWRSHECFCKVDKESKPSGRNMQESGYKMEYGTPNIKFLRSNSKAYANVCRKRKGKRGGKYLGDGHYSDRTTSKMLEKDQNM